MKPPYAPNVVNQTVSYGGVTWKGNPGSDWTPEVQSSPSNNGGQAQTDYQAAIGTAVSGLKEAGTNLDTQYGSLLQNVLGQGTVAMNTVTTGENNLLGARGITNNSPLYSAQMGSAQLPVQVANQTATSNLGYTQAGLKLSLANQIAGLTAGGAGTAVNIPLQYGSLALAQAANTANIFGAYAAGSANQFIPIPGLGVYDLVNKKIISSNGLSSTGRTIVGNF